MGTKSDATIGRSGRDVRLLHGVSADPKSSRFSPAKPISLCDLWGKITSGDVNARVRARLRLRLNTEYMERERADEQTGRLGRVQ